MRPSSSSYLPQSHVPQLLIASPPEDGLFPSTPIPAVFSSPPIPTADKPPLTPEKTYGELLEEREEEDRQHRWLREEERRRRRDRREKEEEERRLKREQEEKRRKAVRDEKQRRKHERDERRRKREREDEERRRRKHVPRPDPQPKQRAEEQQTAEEGKPSRWRDMLKEMDAGGNGRAERQETRRRQQEAAAVSSLWSLKDELELKQETGGGGQRSMPAALTDSGSDQAEERGQWEAAVVSSSSSSPSLSGRPPRRVFAAPQYESVWSSASSVVSSRPHRRRRRTAALHQGRQPQPQHPHCDAYHRPSPPPAAFAQHEALLWSSSPAPPPPAASSSSSLWSTPSHDLHHRSSLSQSSHSFALASPSYARLLPLPVGLMAVGAQRSASPPPFVPLQCRQTAIELSSEDDAEDNGLIPMGRGRAVGYSRQEAEQEAADQQSWAVLLDGRELQSGRRAEDRLMPEDWPDVDDGSGSNHRPHGHREDAALLQQARAVNQQAQQLQQPSAALPPPLPPAPSSLLHPRRAAPVAGRRRAHVPPFVPLTSAIEDRVRLDLQRMAARASEEGGGEAIGSRSAALHCIDPLAMSRAKAEAKEREEEERRLRRRDAERKEEEAKRRRREDWMAQRLQEVERQLGHALPVPSLYSLHQPQQPQQRDAQREAEEERRRDEARMGNVELMIGRLEEKSRQIYQEMMGRDPPSSTAMPMPPQQQPQPSPAAAAVPAKVRKDEAEGEEERMKRQMMELEAQDITERMTALLSSAAAEAELPPPSRAPPPPASAMYLSPSRPTLRARERAVSPPIPMVSIHPSLAPAPMPPGEKLKLSLLRGRKETAARPTRAAGAARGGGGRVKQAGRQDEPLHAEAAGLIDAFRQEFGSALRAATQQL